MDETNCDKSFSLSLPFFFYKVLDFMNDYLFSKDEYL